jgi:hexokinase
MEDYIREVKRLFESPISLPNLMNMSAKLQEQFAEKLQNSDICMLPSYNHTLPSGDEKGSYLAIDVGGSTLRIALVELCGRQGNRGEMKIVKMFSYCIDNSIRSLKGREFFDWMAERVEESISNPEVRKTHGPGTYSMGVAWSFPIEYVISPNLARCVYKVVSNNGIDKRQFVPA